MSVLGYSEAYAREVGMRDDLSAWPVSEGWQGHHVRVNEMRFEDVEKVYQLMKPKDETGGSDLFM
jgi:hypothetical protein